ncbi:MAG: M20/M25/M40 family metallo-hydrolase, partial [Armatimonadetes bacterium]|nr:M20/M25/M40 family metallo-hydrolase [Candidatus Hippobium faecium]
MINEKRLTDFFEELCRINSPSKNEKEIIEYLKKFYTDLGFECWEDHAAKETGGNANNLYGCLKGNPNKKSVCFNAHTDTVMPTENINIINDGKIIKTDGTTILGADDKAGIACATEAVRSIIEQGEDHGDIYILSTVQEEIGVGGANCVTCENFSPDITFSFDTGKPVLCMVASAPTHYRMKYTIEGKASHAAYPQDSTNAIKCACNA